MFFNLALKRGPIKQELFNTLHRVTEGSPAGIPASCRRDLGGSRWGGVWNFGGWGVSDFFENLSFWGSGRPRGALKPSKKAGGLRPSPF